MRSLSHYGVNFAKNKTWGMCLIVGVLFFFLANQIGSTLFLQLLIVGILLGGLYALFAIGLTLIYGVMRIINFAHGELLMLGSYCTYYLFSLLNVNPILSLFITTPLLFLVGLGLRKTVLNNPELLTENSSLIITFGLSIFLSNLALNVFSADFRSIPYLITSVKVYNIYLPATRLIAFSLSILLTFVLLLFLNKGKWGMGLRATSQNPEVSQAVV